MANSQQDNAPCQKTQIILNWFLNHDDQLIALQWPPQTPDQSNVDVVEWEISHHGYETNKYATNKSAATM